MTHTVAIVDDHLLIAKAITSIIEKFRDYEVLFEAENGKALIEKFQHKKNIPDVVLLDISMPVMDGFETATWLKENHPEVLVMALTVQGDDVSLIRMIRCGARCYLQKNVHPVELEKALDSLFQKGSYYPDWATSTILHSIMAGDEKAGSSIELSDREKEFLKYACLELTYKEIGEKMFCSPRTVESYRDALFQKLGVNSRVALALYAVKIGLHQL